MYVVIFKATTKELDEENNIRNKMKIKYITNQKITSKEFIDILKRSTLGGCRPIENEKLC